MISVISDSIGYNRTYVNSIEEITQQVGASYISIFQMVLGFVRSIPPLTTISLFFLMGSAFALVAFRAFRNSALQGFFAIALVALLPIGMRLSYVINQETFADIARAMPSVAFMAAFASAVCLRRFFAVAVTASLVVAYSSFTVLVQESSAAAIKTWHETAMTTRIVARIEPLLTPGDLQALVILGSPPFDGALYVRAPERPLRPQTKNPAFISYRQVAMTNFVLGEELVKSPNAAQKEHARRASAGRSPWPASGSVFRDGDIIVVLLDKNYQEGDVTW